MEAGLWFKCDRCNNLDHMKATGPSGTGEMLCHRCQHGCWHDHFSEVQYDESLHDVVNGPSRSPQSFLGGPVFPAD